MGRSSGAGSPGVFRCANCRRKDAGRQLRPEMYGRGYADRVWLTGREKPNKAIAKTAGTRRSELAREYKCLDCGHVGWSAHIDLERAGHP